MSQAREEGSSSSGDQGMDVVSAVRELHGLNSLELNKLMKDAENNILQIFTGTGSSIQIDVEKLARLLPSHLIAKVMLSKYAEPLLRYLLCGIRLLHSLCDIAPRHSKLEQILLDDVKVSELLLDLIIHLLILLGNYGQELCAPGPMPLLHSALVACSLYLLTGCIAPQWQDTGSVLIAYRKVDIFMTAAFAALRIDIKFLQTMLSGSYSSTESSSDAEGTLNYLCQQCEASLQVLQSLCQQKLFREHLVKNKDLCGNGGILLMAHGILKLNATPLFSESSSVVAAVSRLKSKVLSILLNLCEAESLSYLDEVASTPQSMNLGKSVALEVLELLKVMGVRNSRQLNAYSDRHYPMGLLQLNAMRLADIFSDDSNFRSFFTIYFTEVLTAIFSLPQQDFLSSWCSSNLPIWEEDASLEYDSFAAAGCVLDSFLSPELLNVKDQGSNLVSSNLPKASYAHQRASLLVKVIANLDCYVPEICKEEKDVFLNKFLDCLRTELSKFPASEVEKAEIVSKNLRSLLSHAESLTPPFLNGDDILLLRKFFQRLQPSITPPEFDNNRVEEAQSGGGCSSPLPQVGSTPREGMSENSVFHEEGEVKGRSGALVEGFMDIDRDAQNDETSESDSSSTQGRNFTNHVNNVEFLNSNEQFKESGFEGFLDDEKVETVPSEEKQRRKRKRTIMNEKQIALIEKALVDEPDMQRNSASVQSWADKLSVHGFEVTASQLKNWLNNRKARLARVAKDVRFPSEGDNSFQEKQGGGTIASNYDPPQRPAEGAYIPLTAVRSQQNGNGESTSRIGIKEEKDTIPAEFMDISSKEFIQSGRGQFVVLVDAQGEEVGKGKVYQVQGRWCGCNLEESETCVVDVIELKAERWTRLPRPCEATGTSFDEAEKKLGSMRVMWDSNKLYMLPPR